MRRLLTITAALVAASLALAVMPAQAASTSWKDPEGDAIGYLGAEPPRPSEPAYDILDVTMGSDAKDLTVVAKFKQLGTIPPQATGNVYRLGFTIGEGEYTLSIIQDRIGGDFSAFAVFDATTMTNTATDCARCTGTLNVERNQVEMRIPIGSLDSARRAAGVAGKKIETGSKLEVVTMGAGEYYNFGYHIPGVTETTGGVVSLNNTADEAPLPEPGAFTL